MKDKTFSGIILSLLLLSMLTLAFNIQTARSDGTQETDRPWYDMVNLKSNKIIDFSVISGEKFFEAKQKAGGQVKEDVVPTVLYPNGEIYYYVEQTSQNGVVFYLRYFPGIPATYEVTVYVEPVDTYIIWIEDAWGSTVAGPSVSDGSGDFTACLEDGTYIAFAQPPVGGAKGGGFTVPDDTEVPITFCYEVTIHVQDSSGNPLTAKVSIIDVSGTIVAGPGQTDDNGDFLAFLADGSYKATAMLIDGTSNTVGFTVPDETYVEIIFASG